MIDLTIDVPTSDVERLNAMIQRYVEHFRGNVPKTVEKTMVKLIVSLRAANTTMISDKTRKIVRNPNRYNGSKRQASNFLRAHEHIQDWYKEHPGARRTGKRQPWLPKRKDLERGAVPSKLAIQIYTQRRGIKYFQLHGIDKIGEAKTYAQVMYPKQHNIGRRGLARSSWSWMLKSLGKSSGAEQAEINNVVSVSKEDRISGGVQSFQLTANNKLNYIRKALKSNVNTVLQRVSKTMLDEIEGHKKGAKQKAGMAA